MDDIDKPPDKPNRFGEDENDGSKDEDYMGESGEEGIDSSDSMVSLVEDEMDDVGTIVTCLLCFRIYTFYYEFINSHLELSRSILSRFSMSLQITHLCV